MVLEGRIEIGRIVSESMMLAPLHSTLELILFRGTLSQSVSPHWDESPVLFLRSPLEADLSSLFH